MPTEEKIGIEEKVKEIVSKQLGLKKEEITDDSHLANDLGADSLDAIEIIMLLEDTYKDRGLKISDEDAQKLQTYGAIVDYLTERI